MKFIKGVDLSTLVELEKCGATYFDGKEERDVLDILKDYGMNSVRVRLWNDPYSEDGEPYGAGTNDMDTTLEITRRVIEKGYDVLLDIHYSDFWADPGKQFKPKAWKDYDADQLETAVFTFTKETMERFKKENIFPAMVQVGNELSNVRL